jgi:uncharacterized membrane protein YeaQ/YmgE (transglycosylase-associated protein family)
MGGYVPNGVSQAVTVPALTLAFIISTLLGAGAHLLVGGDAKRLATLLIAGWVGFALGQIAGVLFQVNIFSFGVLKVLPAVAGSLIAITVVIVLTTRRTRKRKPV